MDMIAPQGGKFKFLPVTTKTPSPRGHDYSPRKNQLPLGTININVEPCS